MTENMMNAYTVLADVIKIYKGLGCENEKLALREIKRSIDLSSWVEFKHSIIPLKKSIEAGLFSLEDFSIAYYNKYNEHYPCTY